MPDVVTLGPLMLSFERLVALVLIGLYLIVAGRILAGPDSQHAGAAWLSVLAGLAAARIGFVAMHWTAYRPEPWSALYVWQGGFSATIGIMAAAATLIVRLRDVRLLVRPMLVLGAASLGWFMYVQLDRAAPRDAFPFAVEVTDLQGSSIALERFKGRPFVVNLWASWCAPCRREMPMLVSAASKNRQVPILLVNQGEHAALIERFLQAERLTGDHVLADRGAALMRLAGGGGLPTTLFVRADGKIEDVRIGELSRAALASGISQIQVTGNRERGRR